MDWKTLLLMFLGSVPGIILGFYVWKKDRVEKEPFKLLLILFIGGILIGTPAGILNGLNRDIILEVIGDWKPTDVNVMVYHALLYLGVGFVEEGLKFCVLFFCTHSNKNFNCLFDGIIYAVFVSLGFAISENIFFYILPIFDKNGFQAALSVSLLRAVLSVPFHVFFAVDMGINYTQWKLHKTAAVIRKTPDITADMSIEESYREFLRARKQEPVKYRKYLFFALLSPMLMHAFYNFFATYDSYSTQFLVVFYIMVAVRYVIAFHSVRKYSKNDGLIYEKAEDISLNGEKTIHNKIKQQ